MQPNIVSELRGPAAAPGDWVVQRRLDYARKIRAGSRGWARQLAQAIADQVIPKSPPGFTFNPRLNRCLALGPNTDPAVYIVSLEGHQLRLPRIPAEEDLALWTSGQWASLLCEGNYIGGWPWHADYFLDVSVLIRGKAAAKLFAWANHQFAIYHPATGKSYSVPNDMASRPTLSFPDSTSYGVGFGE
jgi:hypothetical protein